MRSLALASCLFALAACAPQLRVSHADPMMDAVEVKVDGERVGFVELHDRRVFKVRRGWHHVSTIPEGQSANPWAPDGQGWMIYVDRRAEVTLLPSAR